MSGQPPATVVDVDQAEFPAEVLERSHDQPVVVDFWAAWCGPCRTLGPMLTEAVHARDGSVRLAKVDVDRNQPLAARYGVQGIPAVKGFRDGEVVAEFTGAVPRSRIEAFLDELVPSEVDLLVVRGTAEAEREPEAAAATFRAALEAEPDHRDAAVALARLLVGDDPEAAADLVRPHLPNPDAEAITARARVASASAVDPAMVRARLARDPADGGSHLDLGRLLVAEGDHDAGVDHLLEAVRLGGPCLEPAREHLVALFTALGPEDEVVRRARPLLARALY